MKPGLSIVIPCLNERNTIEGSVREAFLGLQRSRLPGEVIVADNGSWDGSRELALKAGARVVDVPHQGYGLALDGGIREARNEFVAIGDADLSYPFLELPALVKPLLMNQADFVLGNRLNPRMQKGAMPFLNRHLGTPALSFLIRRLHRFPIRDCTSGMRVFRRKHYEKLNLRTSGMEFTSEMILAVARERLRYQEIDIPFRKDQRGHPSHLRRWRDGWKCLRLIIHA